MLEHCSADEMCVPQVDEVHPSARRRGAADVGGSRDGSSRSAGKKRHTPRDEEGDGQSGDDDFAETRRSSRRRVTNDDDEPHMQTVRLLCQSHVVLPQVLTFMGMGKQQRQRLIIQCTEVAKENKVEVRLKEPNPESESGQLTVTLVARFSEDATGSRGAGSRAHHKQARSTLQSTAVPPETLSPYLQIIGLATAVPDSAKIACLRGLLANEQIQCIKDVFTNGWEQSQKMIWTVLEERLQALHK